MGVKELSRGPATTTARVTHAHACTHTSMEKHATHKCMGANMHAHTQILKARGPDKELREPVRVSAPIRPKAVVCVCRQA